MKRVLIILALVTTLWIPEYLWAMDGNIDASLSSYPQNECLDMN